MLLYQNMIWIWKSQWKFLLADTNTQHCAFIILKEKNIKCYCIKEYVCTLCMQRVCMNSFYAKSSILSF